MKFEGGREIERALMDLPHTTAKASARRMLKLGAQPIADAERALAPEREGDLRDSIGVGTRLTRRQRKVSRSDRADVEVYVGPGEGGYQAGLQTEFGNEHQAAEPHLRPAWDSERENALQIIADNWWSDIVKTVARHARKLAKGKG